MSLKTLHQVVNPLFHQNKAERCSLLSVLSQHFRYHVVLEKSEGGFEVQAIISGQGSQKNVADWLSYSYSQHIVLEQPDYHLLIPSEAYSSESAEGLMTSHAGELTGGADFRHEYVMVTKAYLLSPIKFKKARKTSTFNLVQFFQTQQTKEEDALVNIDFRFDHILISAFKKGQIVFSNTFQFSSREDILYFVLACFEKLDLQQGVTPLVASGFLRPGSELMKLLKEYFGNIQTARPPKGISFHPHFKDVPLHFYFSGLITPYCE